jgi:hypothetical protein
MGAPKFYHVQPGQLLCKEQKRLTGQFIVTQANLWIILINLYFMHPSSRDILNKLGALSLARSQLPHMTPCLFHFKLYTKANLPVPILQ